MACFLVPAAEAVIVTAVAQIRKRTGERAQIDGVRIDGPAACELSDTQKMVPLSRKLMWLSYLLWGGAALLMYEHIWHGEVVPWFPFLTAAANPADFTEMLHEMSTVGVAMAAVVTAAWGAAVAVVQNKVRQIVKGENI